jgi:hypothetical protein
MFGCQRLAWERLLHDLLLLQSLVLDGRLLAFGVCVEQVIH